MNGGANIWPVLALSALAGCEFAPPATPTPKPVPEIQVTPEPSATSLDYRAYYARVQQQLLTHGQLRRDGGGLDTPITQQMLIDNFAEIALKTEFSFYNSPILSRRMNQPQPVTKFTGPVRARMIFGAHVPDETRSRDQAEVTRYLSRLSRITGLPMGFAPDEANLLIYVLDADEIKAMDEILPKVVPGMPKAAIAGITSLPRTDQCVVLPLTNRDKPNEIALSVVVVRAEQPDLMRLSCYHEEIAQGMGLGNDSPRARPSIFNDDNEFATLTSHDELSLRLLYDPRLAVGTDPASALAVVQGIVGDYFGPGT